MLPEMVEVTYETVGKLPDGQVEVVAMDVTRNHTLSRIRLLCEEPCLANYVTDVKAEVVRIRTEQRKKKNQRAKELRQLAKERKVTEKREREDDEAEENDRQPLAKKARTES
ncbi:uncharacterized protein BDZ99DRAFT_483209 [Mytilinidion resinicola]|uniref:Uncharacterized protein n=1 Tax=Mytilinidion resinicola TaxID=574789 RepID=A0A6A6Y064_9PEZI|nr:uncharacterized protein BDZ99DRAFT_483209 [Mytilinidion resinicola]KAF2802201.1 hypothetical protein BDZ99DRAFT_483209 [Mytilinidion resinicola]